MEFTVFVLTSPGVHIKHLNAHEIATRFIVTIKTSSDLSQQKPNQDERVEIVIWVIQ